MQEERNKDEDTSRKRKRGVIERKNNQKIGRDEKRIASLAAVESGKFTMIQDFKLRYNHKDSNDDTTV